MLAAYRIEKFSKTLIKVAWFILKDFSVFAGSNPKLHFFPCGILLVMEFHDKQFHHLMKDFIFQHTFVGINIVMAFIENGREISRRAQLIETWQIIRQQVFFGEENLLLFYLSATRRRLSVGFFLVHL